MKLLQIIALIIFHKLALSVSIDVLVSGEDNGVKSNKQIDFKEALLNAKLKAIERSGIEVSSTTRMLNFELEADLIETRANGMLMPGFQILDLGYQLDGHYLVVLSGKISNDNFDNDIEDKYNLASLLKAQGQFEQSATLLNEIISAHPESRFSQLAYQMLTQINEVIDFRRASHLHDIGDYHNAMLILSGIVKNSNHGETYNESIDLINSIISKSFLGLDTTIIISDKSKGSFTILQDKICSYTKMGEVTVAILSLDVDISRPSLVYETLTRLCISENEVNHCEDFSSRGIYPILGGDNERSITCKSQFQDFQVIANFTHSINIVSCRVRLAKGGVRF